MSDCRAQATLITPAENPFLFTKEFLLGFFDKAQEGFPEGIDTDVGATVEETQVPLANLPLTDIEKRVRVCWSFNCYPKIAF